MRPARTRAGLVARFFAPLAGRRAAVATVVVVELALAWTAAAVLAFPIAGPLARHPDGVFALYAEGGRLAMDLLRLHHLALQAAALGVAAVLGLDALAWLFLGALVPALFATHEAPPLHRAAAYSLRRAPAVLALAALALIGYTVAALTGWFGYAYGARKALLLVDARAADLQQLYAVLPALVLAALVSVWHDAARVRMTADGSPTGRAAAGAAGDLARSPLRTLGAAAGFGLLGLLGPLAAYGASLLCGGRPAAAAVIALVVVEQLALTWRRVVRVLWFAHLAAPWRRNTALPPDGAAS